MTDREIVEHLISDYSLVFWGGKGLKGPREKDWLERGRNGGYRLDDYREGDGVGMMHGVPLKTQPDRYVVDVDIDFGPGAEMALAMLPATNMVWGRAGKRVSHCIYLTPDTAGMYAYKDIDDSTLIEFRSDVHQAMCPPSVWEKDGKREPLKFEKCGAPALVENASKLKERTCLSAIGMILARHLGHNGFGHESRLAWAGFLLRAGIDAEDLIRMGVAVSRYCNNTEVGDVRTVVESTVRALAQDDKKVKGGPALAKAIGERGNQVVKRINQWLGRTNDLEHPLTEAGDAECFADLYQDRVRYDHRRGRWLVCDEASGIWLPDPTESLTQMVVEMMRARQRQALTLTDDAKKKAIAWTIAGESRHRVANTLALARSVPPIADGGEHWDENPMLIGVQNGVIDLQTGSFRKALPADRVTMRVRVAYDPAATCPLWMKTLGDIFAPPADTPLHEQRDRQEESQRVIDFMQRALGYSITGDCREECCFFTWGEGGNGKGTVMNTLGWLFGDYTDDMPYSTLERSDRGSGIPNDVAKLVGKRFITCAEVNEFNLNEARLKALTGRDPMTARFLHQEFFTFIPVCKIWIATNNKPKITGQDDGIWRRIHLIPFTQKFEGRENKQLKDQLRAELPGILNWIIEGARLWIRDGLNPPETVKAATAAYRQESNPITPFIEACCVKGAELKMQAGDAFKQYEQFCRDEGVEQFRRLSNKAFYKAMEQVFVKQEKKVDGTRRAFYFGVGLLQTTSAAKTAAPDEGPSDVDDSMAANPEGPEVEVQF